MIMLLVTEGTSEYTTCSGLLTASSSTWPQTALFQIAASGVSLDKLVIGKPGTTADANNGYMSTSTLASCVAQAYSSGWSKFSDILPHKDSNAEIKFFYRCRCYGLGGRLHIACVSELVGTDVLV